MWVRRERGRLRRGGGRCGWGAGESGGADRVGEEERGGGEARGGGANDGQHRRATGEAVAASQARPAPAL